MKTLEYVFTHSRGQYFVHIYGDFPFPFGPIARDLVQTIDPIIKKKVAAFSQPQLLI